MAITDGEYLIGLLLERAGGNLPSEPQIRLVTFKFVVIGDTNFAA